ncbi:MAG TPA: hypothetical protein VFC06_04165 [Demequina sp.]|nr:hypothetical protein [Demequina sp.]
MLVSQYRPTSELGRVIESRPHEMWFNPPRNASLFNCLLISASMAVTRHRTLYRKRRYLHAKAIVFYLKSGKRVAISGSHNFVRGGVTLGTAGPRRAEPVSRVAASAPNATLSL